MAKWTITFEDVPTEHGMSATTIDLTHEGDPTNGQHWTAATLCALLIHWAWSIGLFQKLALRKEPAIAAFYMEKLKSREKSPPG